MNFISKYRYILILIGLFLLQFLIVSPVGEFPLNDDWVHAEMVHHWAETGSFRLNPYTGPMLHLLIAFGTGLVKIFGFSFFILRLSTLVFTLGIMILFYLLLHHLTKKSLLSFLVTLTLWLNPIVYNLSFTFMTDIPALFFLIAGIYVGVVAFEKNDSHYVFLAAVLSVTGFFIRQTNILLLPAIGLPILFYKQYRSWPNFIALAVPSFVWTIVYFYFRQKNLLPGGQSLHIITNKSELLRHAFWWLYYTIMYVGLFTLPITIGIKKINKKTLCFIALLLCIAAAVYYSRQEYFPYVSNMVNRFGLGPLNDVLQGTYVPLFRTRIWLVVTALAAIGSGLLFATLKKSKPDYVFLWLFVLFFMIPILVFTSFDRYFLPLAATFLIVITASLSETPLRYYPGFIVLGIMAFYSMSQTQFYMEWNKTRWELAERAVKGYDLKTNQVEAGYEWDGWHEYWNAQSNRAHRGPIGSPWWNKSLIPNNTLEYIVSASPLPGYAIVDHRIVLGRNPNQNLYLLKK